MGHFQIDESAEGKDMTYQGVAESLVATTIWVSLAFIVKNIKDRLEKQKTLYRDVLDSVSVDALQNVSLSQKLDMYFITNVVVERSRHDLLKIENIKHTILLLLLVLLITLPTIPYVAVALQTLFFGMLWFINITRNRLIEFVDKFELALVKGITTNLQIQSKVATE